MYGKYSINFYCLATVACILILATRPAQSVAQELSASQVRRSIERGKKHLLKSQLPNGSWQGINDARYIEGTTALATLALLNSGVSHKSKPIQKAIDRLIDVPSDRIATYVGSLRLMVLTAADPKSYAVEIQKDVDWLVKNQVTSGPHAGGWSYPLPTSTAIADSSNSQYALLALHEASAVGAKIPKEVWQLAQRYWTKCFSQRSGGFGYSVEGNRINAAMTCAGISSLIICQENLAEQRVAEKGGKIECCQPNDQSEMITRALKWLADRFSVKGNSAERTRAASLSAKYYYLYGLERVGRLSGRRFIGIYDWYREGAKELLDTQKSGDAWIGQGAFSEGNADITTSFALLFLSKGKRPIVMGKYKSGVGNDWDRHPKGIHYLTKELETQWKTKLNWQTVDGAKATVYDLAESPVLYISGRDQLDLTTAQKKALKEFVENGNFIFAEACQGNGCGENVAFDKKFRALMLELFPDSELSPLAANHPIWNSHFEIFPNKDWPVLGLQACCRTSVVYVPRSLTGHWQFNRDNVKKNASAAARAEIDYAAELGVNVVSYATGRQLRDKLDLPDIRSGAVSVLANRALVLPKLKHSGGADDAPNAWRNVLNKASEIGLTIDVDKVLVSPVPEQLFDYPFLFMHGRNRFFFKNVEVDALQMYLKGGNRGFIFADSICSSKVFNNSFEKEIVRLVPGAELKPIPADHPIWSDRYGGFNIDRVTITKPDRTKPDGFAKRTVSPQFKGIEIDGRLVVVYSPLDLSCALENAALSHCEGYTKQDAIRLALNVLLYRLQSD